MLHELTLTELQEGLRSKQFTSQELVQASFRQIDAIDGHIGAFLHVCRDEALKQAQKSDQLGYDANSAALQGIPVGIKDNIVTKGILTTAASRILEDFNPIYDATVVKKLTDQGAVTIGKLNMDEFAMGGSNENSYFHVVRNPWDDTKVPGGSSGGSAAAVAAREVVASLGSDTGGSIRQPAAFTNLVGMKPTYGRVSRYGLIAFASSLDQIGPLTRNVRDNAVMLSAISGHDSQDSTSAPIAVPDFTKQLGCSIKGLRIALPTEYLQDGVSEDIRQAVLAARDVYQQAGAIVEEVALPHSRYGIPAYYIIASSEASSNLQRFDGVRYGYRAADAANLEELYVRSRTEGFGAEVKRRIMLGTFSLSSGYYDAYFKKAAQVRTLIAQDFANIFERYDVIMGPTTTTAAFGLNERIDDPLAMYLADLLTVPANLAGIPALSVPAGFTKEGLPIGLQLQGRHFDEATLYQVAHAFEQATDYHTQRPRWS